MSTKSLPPGRSGAALALPCNGSHGPSGVGHAGRIPSIAGLNKDYQYEVLLDFEDGRWGSTIMQRIADGDTGPKLSNIARYFSRRSWSVSNPSGDAEQVTRIREFHDMPCKDCHEDGG